MKSYETVWEIFNQCANNQMRDVFFDEIEIEDPEQFIQQKFKGQSLTYEREVLADGTVIFYINASGIRQKYSFTEI